MNLNSFFQAVSHILMPKLCCACDKALLAHEEIICTDCYYHLAITDFHLDPHNESAKQLWGKLEFEFASSMLYLSKSSHVERLLHRLKFKGYAEIGEFLGYEYAKKLAVVQEQHQFDYIVPIPIHPKKLRKRGYNQAECFAKGLSKGLKVSVLNDLLIRSVYSASQTTKARVERYDNVEKVFDLSRDSKELLDKHVLLVDDVLTTGATLCVAGNILKQAGAKVSIITLARA